MSGSACIRTQKASTLWCRRKSKHGCVDRLMCILIGGCDAYKYCRDKSLGMCCVHALRWKWFRCLSRLLTTREKIMFCTMSYIWLCESTIKARIIRTLSGLCNCRPGRKVGSRYTKGQATSQLTRMPNEREAAGAQLGPEVDAERKPSFKTKTRPSASSGNGFVTVSGDS